MWINALTQRVYRNQGEVRSDFPTVMIPEGMPDYALAEIGVFPVEPVTPSFDAAAFKAVELAPILLNGVFYQAWDIQPLGVMQADAKRTERNDALLSEVIDAIQLRLDNKARERGYDGILSLCSYATSKNQKFGPEGAAGVVWRDALWEKGYEILEAVRYGSRPIPTVDEVLAELPAMEWPQ